MLRNPSAPAPSHCTVQGVYLPLQGMHGWGKDCLHLIPFKMLQISSFTLSLKCFSSDPDSCPSGGIGPLLQSPHPPRAGPVLLTHVFPPSSFILPSFAWVYIFFPAGQVLLSALGWCSACTSASEAVFLMYPWRETYSTSTYSSAILFSSLTILVLMAFLYVIIIQKSLLYQKKHLFKYKIYCKIYVSLKNKYTV